MAHTHSMVDGEDHLDGIDQDVLDLLEKSGYEVRGWTSHGRTRVVESVYLQNTSGHAITLWHEKFKNVVKG